MIEEADPLGLSPVDFSCEHVDGGAGARLRVLRWRAPSASGRPLVFIPGWVSVIEGWRDLLRELVPRRPIVYLDTREKSTAILDRPRLDGFRIRAMAVEVCTVLEQLGVDLRESVVSGSSLGASVLLEAMKSGRLRPHAAFLVGPTCHFDFPLIARPVVWLPAASYHLMKHVVLWYLRTFRVDVEREPEQIRRYEQTLLPADPKRMKLSAQAVAGYRVWGGLEAVQTPVGVAYATTDRLHKAHVIERLLRELPRATPVPCPSNKHMHSAALAPDLERFIAAVDDGRAYAKP